MKTVFGFLLIIFVFIQDSYAQFVAPGYTVKHWTIQDGLPVNSANGIIQAKNGYLWLATTGGLVRFDGVNFKVYTSADYPGLRGNRILALVEGNDGSIIVMNQGADIFALKDEVFTLLSSSNQGVVGEVRDKNFYYKDTAGRIWFGDDTGIKVYSNGRLESFSPELIQKPVERILKAEDGVVWFTYFNDTFLYRYEDDTAEKILDQNVSITDPRLRNLDLPERNWISLSDNNNDNETEFIVTPFEIYSYKDKNLSTIYELNEGAIVDKVTMNANTMILSLVLPFQDFYDRSIFGFKDGQLIKSSVQPGGFTQMFHRKKKYLWFATDTEIYRDNDLILESIAILGDPIVDKEGTLWIPTVNEGLLQLKENLFSTFSARDGLNYDNVNAVLQARDSSIWVGTFGKGVNKISDGDIYSNTDIQGDLKSGHIYTIEQLADQTLLIGGLLGGGINYLNPETNSFEPYLVPESIGNFSVHSMFEDSQQRLWVGTSPRGERGLFVRENGAWKLLAGRENIPYATYQYIMETPRSDIWASARGEGLVRYDGISYYHYSTKDGFSSDFIRGLYVYIDPETEEEWLFVGSEGDGLDIVRLDKGEPVFSSLVTLDKANGLYENSIHVILEDDFGRFWMNTNQGIFWITKKEVFAFIKGKINTITSISYTEEDGLVNREGNGGSQPAGIKALDGTLWFPGQGGVATVDPANIAKNSIAPPIQIQRIDLENGSIVPTKNEVLLNADQRDFEIHYAALSFLNPEKNQYRYKLEGFRHQQKPSEWHNVGTRRTAYFTNVPAGTYTFRVQGSNSNGLWGSEIATIKIIVKPRFYEAIWFAVFLGSSFIGLILLIVATRERQARKNQKELELIISERTNDLRKEKEEVERQKQVIDELSSAKDNFFTNISHELRTPLTLVLGPLQSMAREDVNLPVTWKRNLELAQRNGYRLKQLVEQMLDLARLESGKIEINPIKLDVGTKVRLITESFESLAKSKGIILKTFIPGEEVCAGVDSDKFQKILVNLISNAIKFTPEKGVIEVAVKLSGDFVELSVSDTGIGIPKDRIPYVFDRFHSEEGEVIEKRYGLGVGLNLTKEFVQLHGGTITVDSEHGKGTTFLVTLRSCPKTMAEEGEAVLDEQQDANIYDSPPHVIPVPQKEDVSITSILLVEDNPDMREYITDLLSKDNIEIITATNGIEGKKKLTLTKPDLIISDVKMPDMDGFEFSQYVRSVPEYRLTPIMILTALSDLDNRLQAFDIGVSDYLTKPFVEKELKVRIHNLLRLKGERDLARSVPDEEENEELSEGTAFARKLQEYVSDNITNSQISVEELGDVANMSRRQFYRKLKTETGFTPAEFVREIRLLKARQIIENKRAKTISEVAYAVGFSTPSYFTKVFEERFGDRPGNLLRN